jgi:hypothetical protein
MAEHKGPSVNYFTLRCVAHRKIRPEARPFGVMKPWSARASRETCYKQSMPLADLNALWPADANAVGGDAGRIMDPLGRRRRQSGHRAFQRGASELARGQVVRPSDLRHLDGTPVQSSLSRCSNSGSRAMLTAIRRASSGVHHQHRHACGS